MAAVGQAADGALRFLVGLGSAHEQAQASVVLADVPDVERDQLVAPQRPGEANSNSVRSRASAGPSPSGATIAVMTVVRAARILRGATP